MTGVTNSPTNSASSRTRHSRPCFIGLDGSVDRKETHRAPYVKGTFKVPKNFPVSKITSSDEMTITAELANGQVYVLSSAWLHGEANHNAEEGTVDLEFHGEEGDYQ